MINHSRMIGNLAVSLKTRVTRRGCDVLTDAGIATIGDAVRYPDTLVTRTKAPGSSLLPGAVVVFQRG